MAYQSDRHDILIEHSDDRIKLFMEIREEIREKILKSSIAETLSPAAKQYLSSLILSFAFDKAHIDARAQANGATSIRIYQGATPPHGTPTIVIYPCEINFTNGNTATNRTSSGGGSQHPSLYRTNQTIAAFSGATDTSQARRTDDTDFEE